MNDVVGDAHRRHAERIQAMAALAGPVAHSFNNLLTAITGLSTLALDELEPTHPLHPDLVEIAAAARRAAGLTGQLQTFARSRRLDLTPVDLNAHIRAAEPDLRARGEATALVVRLDESLPPVLADARQVRLVIENLVNNGRDAIASDGTIEITTGRSTGADDVPAGNYGLLRVSDTGVGIEPENLDRVFEPFFTTRPPGERTGLGLPTVFGIVSNGGGHIRVHTVPGEGTTMSVWFPLASSPG